MNKLQIDTLRVSQLESHLEELLVSKVFPYMSDYSRPTLYQAALIFSNNRIDIAAQLLITLYRDYDPNDGGIYRPMAMHFGPDGDAIPYRDYARYQGSMRNTLAENLTIIDRKKDKAWGRLVDSALYSLILLMNMIEDGEGIGHIYRNGLYSDPRHIFLEYFYNKPLRFNRDHLDAIVKVLGELDTIVDDYLSGVFGYGI